MPASDPGVVATARLLVRPPREADWHRFAELFCNEALLAKAHQTYAGELLVLIDPQNVASQNVCRELGFTFWKQVPVAGDIRNLYTLTERRR
ncbi:MAG: hypothetical protein ACRDMV_08130 [Streptosporangiales bacterium]